MKTVLNVSNLSKQYKEKQVLTDVSFSMNEGEILGLIGGNGVGKTTLIRLITGVNQPDFGEINVVGEVDDRSKYIGALIERPAIYKDMSALDNLRYYGKILGLDETKENNRSSKLNEDQKYEALLEKVGLSDYKNKKAGRFSTGMRQRLGIAIALLGDAKCLILDEPFNGLDASGVEDLKGLLRTLKVENVSILITSHMIGELTQICNRYIILDQGQILYEATQEELEKEAGNSSMVEALILEKLGGSL